MTRSTIIRWSPRQGRRRHDGPALRRRPHPEGRPPGRRIRHDRRSRRGAGPRPGRARPKRQHGTLSPGLRGLADLILRFQRELFVAAAELATNPEAWDRQVDGQTRVSAAMVDGVERRSVELERQSRCRASSWCPARRRSAALELARRSSGAPNAGPSRSSADGLIPGPPATVPEPPRRPRLGPGAGGRTGGGATATPSRLGRPHRPKDQPPRRPATPIGQPHRQPTGSRPHRSDRGTG